ncbi:MULTISPECIES: hypothetical protein [Bacteroidaceae]|uniref:hypothetical protein n=1 Tax=Bacteroidaceae TaxID=815 RepID=UPI003D957944
MVNYSQYLTGLHPFTLFHFQTDNAPGYLRQDVHILPSAYGGGIGLGDFHRTCRDLYDPITLHRILLAVRLPASGRQEQHESKCGEIRDNELLVHIFFLFCINS